MVESVSRHRAWRQRGLLAGVVVLFAALPAAGGAATITKHRLLYRGKSRSYYAYVPDKLPPEPAPMMVLLHGSGRDGRTMTRLWASDADREGLVLVAPNAHTRKGWMMREDGPEFIRAVIEAEAAATPIDRRRLYLFGQSAGAVQALLVSMLESTYFAAAAVHAGAWRLPGEFTSMRLARRKIALKIIVGSRDEFFSLTAVHKTERALKDQGFPIDVTIMYGERHWYNSGTAAKINAIAWRFLKDQRLERPPLFMRYQ